MDASTVRDQCLMMAAYNREANRRLFTTCKTMPESELKKDAGAFFGSIHRTLNHILVADEIWLARFEGKPTPHSTLDAVPFDSFDALSAYRTQYDDHIESFFKAAPNTLLTEDFHFQSMAGDTFSKPFYMLAAHVFNHQTHHRGQVLTLVSQAGVETPVLDMPYCL